MEKQKKSGGTVAFCSFATILFALFSIFLAVCIMTTNPFLSRLCEKYVRQAEINTQYYDTYMEYGMTKQDCEDFLTGDGMYELTASVMTQRLTAIFKNNDSFYLSKDDCEKQIETFLQAYGVDESCLSRLVSYTCDISGISSMFAYNTPAAYRQSIFEYSENKEQIEDATVLIEAVSFLCSPLFPLCLGIMYLICVIIVFFMTRYEKGNVVKTILSTIFSPAICLSGLCLGCILGLPKQSIVVYYVLKVVLFTQIGFIFIGGVFYILFLDTPHA